MATAPLYLVVTRGRSTGARLVLDGEPRTIGRSRDADLILRDTLVSRRHALASLAEGVARLEVCDGARPVLVNGEPLRQATLNPGDAVVIGDTPLLLCREAEQGSEAPADLSRTDIRTLMTGVAADVRGLATVMHLVEALDAATDAATVEEALREWSREALPATDAVLSPGDAEPELSSDAASPQLVERTGSAPERMRMSVAVHAGAELRWLTFTCDFANVTVTTRRLAAVAGRITAAALTRIGVLARVQLESESFRREAIGSARSFLGDSAAAHEVARLVPRLAASDTLVLIEGETGVGKTFLARLIHERSARASESLRIINCAAIPDTLIESELFGYERGAFTGATSPRAGAFESAGRGTVLLDEIGELPLASQAKLLRVLEEKRFERLGSNRALRLEARVLVATNRDLAAMAREGKFREDLFYRVAVVKLRIPPLRERGDDLVLLAERILADLTAQAGRRVDGFSPAALQAIRRYAWPGNVRELRNAIERALVVGDTPQIEPGDLPEAVHGAPPPQPTEEALVRLPANLAWLEARAIEAAMRATGGNQPRAALLLGINRTTLHRKLKADKETGGGSDDPG